MFGIKIMRANLFRAKQNKKRYFVLEKIIKTEYIIKCRFFYSQEQFSPRKSANAQ
jgi:hypothetical protein